MRQHACEPLRHGRGREATAAAGATFVFSGKCRRCEIVENSLISWIICLTLGVPCLLLIILNWLSMVDAFRRGQSFSFCPPFLCGLLGAVACLICPLEEISSLAWLPLVLDPSILLSVYVLLMHFFARVTGWFPSPLGRPVDLNRDNTSNQSENSN